MRFLSLFQHDSNKPSLRSGGSSEELMLALKQRARRRLVGAVVLVAVTVITLPLIFDSGQKKGEGAPIIVQTKASLAASPQVEEVGAQAQYLSEIDQAKVSGVQGKAAHDDAGLHSGRALSTGTSGRDMTTTSLSDGEIVLQDARVDSHKKETGAVLSSSTTVKFSIKAGAFASEERARNWVAKLRAEKLPVRVELKKMLDGDLYLLRVGPFLNRAAAHVAQKKIQALGLPGVISESH